jgi:ABC-type transporter Mla subunit MlaD
MHETEHALSQILSKLSDLDQKLDTIMSAQSDVDAAVTALNSFLSDVATQITNIQAALEAGGGTPVDTTALNSVIEQLPTVQEALDALAPATTTTTPPSTPAV